MFPLMVIFGGLVLSPLIVYGIWFSGLTYAHGSATQEIAVVYTYCFSWFASFDLKLPPIRINPAMIGALPSYLEALFNMDMKTTMPTEMLEGTVVFQTFAAFLAVLKAIILWGIGLVAAWGYLFKKPVPFSVSASCYEWGDVELPEEVPGSKI